MSRRNVCQLKITLKGVRPPIWRRILVPVDYTFWELHVAIQDAMGWTDSHLHCFEVNDVEAAETLTIGNPELLDQEQVISEFESRITDYLSPQDRVATYEYDFGDGWRHALALEKIVESRPGVSYPVCLDGRRACPPEDVGGPHGYADFLAALADPAHEAHQAIVDWIGNPFDPEEFLPSEVTFDDPGERLKLVLH